MVRNPTALLPIFLIGLVLGFAIAVPVGPIAALCVSASLEDGRTHGFVVGLGAAVADTFYGAVAAFGVAWLGSFLLEHQMEARVVGAVVLAFAGIRMVRRSKAQGSEVENAHSKHQQLLELFGTSFVMTLANPVSLVAFATVLSAFSISVATVTDSVLLVAGCFLGASLWWFTLAAAASALQRKLEAQLITRANVVMGWILVVFAVVVIASIFVPLDSVSSLAIAAGSGHE